MVNLIDHLNRGGEYAYLWLKDPDGQSETIWYKAGEFPAIPESATNVYFGVNPTKHIPQRGGRSPAYLRATLDDLSAINCLFAEFDAKDFQGDKHKALEHIHGLSLEPNVIIDSGGGYHCYWLMFHPMPIFDHATLEYFRGIQARWVAHVGGDQGAKDLARVLRVPGTYNYKYDPPAEVAIIEQNEIYYELFDLIKVLPSEPEPQAKPEPQPTNLQPNSNHWLEKALGMAGVGNRNKTGFWLAAQLRDDGISEVEARDVMMSYQRSVAGSNGNTYSEREAMQTLKSAYSSAKRNPAINLFKPSPSDKAIVPASPPETPVQANTANNSGNKWLPYDLVKKALDNGEDGDALITADMFRGKLVYDHAEGAWYVWRKHFWERDKTRMVYRLISRRVAPQYLHAAAEAQASGNEEAAKKLAARAVALCNKKRMDNVLFLTGGQVGIAVTGDEWDADPWLLGCGNGVIDLRSGKLRAGRPDDYIRAHSEVDYIPTAECQKWQTFLSEVFGGDTQLVGFVRRLLGYAITGLTREHVFPILWGEGRNGKSTLLETLADVLGNDIATSSQADALMDATRGGDGPKPFIWSLRGKRLVWASESNEGRRINEGLVKQLTGGDRLNVRTLHSKPIEFVPTHTLLLLTNHRPHINADGSAIWERVHLVPFTQRFIDNPKESHEHKRNPNIREDLKNELSGILAWLVRGCLEWQKIGLNAPEAITAATAEYRSEEDTTGMYISDRCIVKEGILIKASILYQDYCSWCKENNVQAMSVTAFSTRMKKKYPAVHKETGNFLTGIGLAVDEKQKIPW